MKTTAKVIELINSNKELTKAINKISYYDIDRFISDCMRYISAIKEGRMLCNIKSISSSGMSRVLNFTSVEKHKNKKQ